MYSAMQNRPNLSFSTRGFAIISLNILIQFLELSNDFKYFIHAGTVLKRVVEGEAAPLFTTNIFCFKINSHEYFFCSP